ncbi:hypothetical protein [Bacillus sp. Marseille-Q3570]|uniref:hypothetical protein n=1 Tax=Bacillus sp. Marseille-Q3570 TaxID=2963522 RepID=UPI0021B8403D|nr:hypothetical protein [Bacillus sp. Marseille-Q3570]
MFLFLFTMNGAYGQTNTNILIEWSYGALIRTNEHDFTARMVVWSLHMDKRARFYCSNGRMEPSYGQIKPFFLFDWSYEGSI